MRTFQKKDGTEGTQLSLDVQDFTLPERAAKPDPSRSLDAPRSRLNQGLSQYDRQDPLLTAAEEIHLGQIQNWVAIRDIPKEELTKEQRRICRTGQRAFDRMLTPTCVWLSAAPRSTPDGVFRTTYWI